MAGPWKAQGFDPVAWQRPAPRAAARVDTADDATTRLVLAYVLAVVAACGGLLLLLARFA
jgi:hypothetical protein